MTVRRHMAGQFYPSLPDRLERDSASGRQWPDVAAIRDILRRDLGYLLNTINMTSGCALPVQEGVLDTVLNYGVDAVAGRYQGDQVWAATECMLRRAILAFEPRIQPDSLVIRPLARHEQDNASHNILSFALSAVVRWPGLSVDICLHSAFDLETARMELWQA